MSLFRYPKAQHIRSLSPPYSSNYRDFKPFLRDEFSRRCVYCQKLDERERDPSFHVDHYRPKSKFPHLENTYANLYYACSGCNGRKGSYWPNSAAWKAQAFIPNPCDCRMFDHLRYRGAEVSAQSRAGMFTLDLLQLNDAASVRHREALIAGFVLMKRKQGELKTRLRQISAKHESEGSPATLDAERREVEADLEKIASHIDHLFGA